MMIKGWAAGLVILSMLAVARPGRAQVERVERVERAERVVRAERVRVRDVSPEFRNSLIEMREHQPIERLTDTPVATPRKPNLDRAHLARPRNWMHIQADRVDFSSREFAASLARTHSHLFTLDRDGVTAHFRPVVPETERVGLLKAAVPESSTAKLFVAKDFSSAIPIGDPVAPAKHVLRLPPSEATAPSSSTKHILRLSGSGSDVMVAPDAATYDRMRLESPDALVLLQKSPNPAAGLLALDDHITDAEVIDGLPRNDAEYEQTFGKKKPLLVTLDVPADFDGARVTRLSAQPNGTSIAEQVAMRVRSAANQEHAVIIVAHVADGMIHLPDGSRLPIGDVALSNVVLVGCNTVKFGHFDGTVQLGTFRTITFREARAIPGRLLKAIDIGVAKGTPTVEHMLRETLHELASQCEGIGGLCETPMRTSEAFG